MRLTLKWGNVMHCPKCDADISDTHESADPSVGILTGGWYCQDCDLSIADWEVDDGSDDIWRDNVATS